MRGLTIFLGVVVLGFVVFFVLGYGARIVVSPWSWSLFRKHTLTGSWYGTLHTEGGNNKAILIEMHLPRRLRAGINLTGSAQVCSSNVGEEIKYDILGRTDGSNVSLKMFSGDPRQPSSGGTLDGTWSEDVLQLSGLIHSTQAKENNLDDPHLSGRLQKGTEGDYRSTCQQMSSPHK
jgi:hypothetical protein